MNVDQMSAGRELDALVAEKVLGWNVCDTADDDKAGIAPGQNCSAIRVPHYSTDLAAAWLVVEHMRAKGWALDSYHSGVGEKGHPWSDAIFLSVKVRSERGARAETFPLSVCRAALRTVEGLGGEAE